MQKRLRDFEIGLCTEPPKASNGDSSYVVYWNEYRFESQWRLSLAFKQSVVREHMCGRKISKLHGLIIDQTIVPCHLFNQRNLNQVNKILDRTSSPGS